MGLALGGSGRGSRGTGPGGRIFYFVHNRTHKVNTCVCSGVMGEHSSTMHKKTLAHS